MDSTLFDRGVDRENTGCIKWDVRDKVFGNGDVLPMWIADMDFAAPECVVEAIIRRARHGAFGYNMSEEADTQALVDWMKRRHGVDVDPQSVCYTPGVVDSLNVAVAALGKPGEKAALLTPVYGPFARAVEKAQMCADRCALIQTEEGWKIDFERLERSFREGAKLMLLCNPHNPVGRVWTRSELEQIVALSRKYGVTIISDEIHADMTFKGFEHIPFATVSEKARMNSITMMAASKSFNIAGLMSSFTIIPNKELRDRYNGYLMKSELNHAHIFATIATAAAFSEG